MVLIRKDYSYCGGLDPAVEQRVKDALYELEHWDSDDGYICDALHEAADSNTPVYNYELYKACADIGDDVESAMREGLIDPHSKNFSFPNMLQIGYCYMLESVLYENLDAVVYNFLIAIANNDPRLRDDKAEEIVAAIEELCEDVDNNKTFQDYVYKYRKAIDPFLDGRGEVSPEEQVKGILDEILDDLDDDDPQAVFIRALSDDRLNELTEIVAEKDVDETAYDIVCYYIAKWQHEDEQDKAVLNGTAYDD